MVRTKRKENYLKKYKKLRLLEKQYNPNNVLLLNLLNAELATSGQIEKIFSSLIYDISFIQSSNRYLSASTGLVRREAFLEEDRL